MPNSQPSSAPQGFTLSQITTGPLENLMTGVETWPGKMHVKSLRSFSPIQESSGLQLSPNTNPLEEHEAENSEAAGGRRVSLGNSWGPGKPAAPPSPAALPGKCVGCALEPLVLFLHSVGTSYV